MFVDHIHPTEMEIKHGWVNPVIQAVVTKPLDGVVLTDEEYISALETMVFWLSFTTGINASIGYESDTRADKIRNFYDSLKKLTSRKL